LSAATVVNFDSGGEAVLLNIAGVQFSILSPATVDALDFNSTWPVGWLDLSTGKIVNAFDGSGSASLSNGQVGYFEEDNVVLGEWVLGNHDAQTLTLGIDYIVDFDSVDYIYTVTTTTPIPIPTAFLLLCSGLIGMLGIRIKFAR
jgi:hypothetical protein